MKRRVQALVFAALALVVAYVAVFRDTGKETAPSRRPGPPSPWTETSVELDRKEEKAWVIPISKHRLLVQDRYIGHTVPGHDYVQIQIFWPSLRPISEQLDLAAQGVVWMGLSVRENRYIEPWREQERIERQKQGFEDRWGVPEPISPLDSNVTVYPKTRNTQYGEYVVHNLRFGKWKIAPVNVSCGMNTCRGWVYTDELQVFVDFDRNQLQFAHELLSESLALLWSFFREEPNKALQPTVPASGGAGG